MTSRVRFVADMDDNVSSRLDKMRDKFDGIVNSKGGGALLMGVGLAGGVGAMGALSTAAGKAAELLGDSINAASDLNEVVSKSGQIFGPVSADIETWASTASKSFGQSKRQALEAATTFATFGKGAGLAGQELASFSTQLSELASDLASFSNASPEEAIQAIGAALRGEAEPMRRFGVLIDDAALRNEALRQGLIKTTKEALTPQQRVLAAQALILRQTGDAQGDFARTSDGLANSQRSLNATIEDLSAEIGATFLPLAAELANTLATDVVPAVRELVQAAKDAKPAWDLLAAGVDVALNGPLARLDDNATEIERWKEAQRQALTDAATAWGDSAAGIAETQRELNRGLIGVARNTDDVRAEQRELEKASFDLTEVLDGLREQVDDVADALGVAVYGPAQLKGKLAELQQELRENIAQLEKLQAIKDPTREQREDIAITKGGIAETREEILKTRTELALLDGTGLSALIKDVERLAGRTDSAGDEARELLRLLRAIADTPVVNDSFRQTGQPGSGNNVRAHGGPVWPGTWTVGEQGPETLVLGSGGRGYVIPNQGGGGGGVSLSVSVNGVNDPEEIARRIVQPLRRELTRQGVSLA